MTHQRQLKGTICPYLGMKNDPTSHMAFPSPLNYCSCCDPSAAVNLKQQDEFCLDEHYITCQVYSTGDGLPLPKALRIKSKGRVGVGTSPIVVVLLMVALGGGIAYWNLRSRSGLIFPVVENLSTNTPTLAVDEIVAQTVVALSVNVPSQVVASETVLPDVNALTPLVTSTVTPFPTLTDTPTLTPTSTVTLTMTPLPTATGTEVPPYSLDVPIGRTKQFVIHRVAAGENIDTLAKKYGSSMEAIQTVNYMMPSPIWAGLTIIIPLGIVDPTGLIILEPYQVTTDQLTIEQIAVYRSADLQLMLKYNNAVPGQRFSVDSWILIPRPPEE